MKGHGRALSMRAIESDISRDHLSFFKLSSAPSHSGILTFYNSFTNHKTEDPSKLNDGIILVERSIEDQNFHGTGISWAGAPESRKKLK